MRPVSLMMEGFLSYRELVRLDFSQLTAAVVVGPNGAGKSSIVEAMGWALFGKGRYQSPDSYVSHGRTDCRVVFDFELGGRVYRVERQRSLSAGGKSYVGLFAHRPPGQWGEEPWYPMGGDHIREVQGSIEELLGLNYDSWIATSFLAQGKADAFTKLGAADRKQLLAEVLQLGQYETLCERAKEQERTLGVDQAAALRRVEQLEAFLAGEEAARERVTRAKAERETAAADVSRLEENHAEALKSVELARSQVEELGRIRERLEELRHRRRLDASRVAEDHARMVRDIEQAEAERQATSLLIEKLKSSAAVSNELEAHAVARRLEADQLEQEAEALRRDATAHDEARASALERVRTTVEITRETKERVELLMRPGAGARCWACDQPLSKEHRDACFAGLEQRLREAEEAAHINQRIASDEERLAEGLRVQAGRRLAQVAALRTEISEHERAAERAAADGERIPHEQHRLASLERRIAELDRVAEEARQALALLSEPGTDERDLEARLADERELADRGVRAKETADLLYQQLLAARSRVNGAAEESARAEETLGAFARAHEELEGERTNAQETGRLRGGYATLALAFGRNGIPALIVENAIPQIEDEANRLLAKLTDGRFSVHLESLRATKAGGIRETLDIGVGDLSAGSETPLEGLSGAERQCVDLSLRIALARVLASRAGRRIETLVVDEGFTAFDVAHRQRAIGDIHALTEEFPIILFITHMREFADAFPTAIEVTREDGTSRVTVSGPVGVAA